MDKLQLEKIQEQNENIDQIKKLIKMFLDHRMNIVSEQFVQDLISRTVLLIDKLEKAGTKFIIRELITSPTREKATQVNHPTIPGEKIGIRVPDWSGPLVYEVAFDQVDNNGIVLGHHQEYLTNELFEKLYAFEENRAVLDRVMND